MKESGQRKIHTLKKVLTVAGSDSGGGAGLQADIKTLTAHGIYAMSAVTALTAQNTRGISGILPVPEEFFQKQMDSIFSDIVPDAVKTGMIYSGRQAEITAAYLREYGIKNVVVDPVMVSTSGTDLTEKYAESSFFTSLFPLARVITPNLPEAEILSGQKILPEPSENSVSGPAAGSVNVRTSGSACGPAATSMSGSALDGTESQSRKIRENAARLIGERFGCAVFLKGGHASGNADDLLYENGEFTWFPAGRIDNPNTHGTGCTLSSAIAANLALGCSLKEAVRLAKEYVNGAIAAKLVIGSGNGPLDHMWKF